VWIVAGRGAAVSDGDALAEEDWKRVARRGYVRGWVKAWHGARREVTTTNIIRGKCVMRWLDVGIALSGQILGMILSLKLASLGGPHWIIRMVWESNLEVIY